MIFIYRWKAVFDLDLAGQNWGLSFIGHLASLDALAFGCTNIGLEMPFCRQNSLYTLCVGAKRDNQSQTF